MWILGWANWQTNTIVIMTYNTFSYQTICSLIYNLFFNQDDFQAKKNIHRFGLRAQVKYTSPGKITSEGIRYLKAYHAAWIWSPKYNFIRMQAFIYNICMMQIVLMASPKNLFFGSQFSYRPFSEQKLFCKI